MHVAHERSVVCLDGRQNLRHDAGQRIWAGGDRHHTTASNVRKGGVGPVVRGRGGRVPGVEVAARVTSLARASLGGGAERHGSTVWVCTAVGTTRGEVCVRIGARDGVRWVAHIGNTGVQLHDTIWNAVRRHWYRARGRGAVVQRPALGRIAGIEEDATTKDLMDKRGIEFVRGGQYCQVKLTEAQQAEIQKTLEQSIEEIANTLLEVEIDSYILDLKNKINQQILDGFSINEISSDNSLAIKTIKNAKRQINQNENDLITSEVIAKGFISNKDFVSDMIDIDENKTIIINVDQVEDEKPYLLNEVFELVSNDWIKSLKIKSVEKKIEETSNNKSSINLISNFIGAEISNNNIKINNNDFSSTLKNNIFTNEINQITLSIVNDDIFVSQLKKITFPEEGENSNNVSMLSELRSNFGAEIIKNKNISTNDNLIQALINQY